MNRAQTFPHARDSWIVHEDDALLFVDKPVGVPSQAADPDTIADDIRARMQRYLEQRDGARPGGVYLGAHQRLDKETSGVLVFTKLKEVNAHVAAELEERRAKKVYLACISGAKLRVGELRHALREGKDGRMVATRLDDRAAARPSHGKPSHGAVVAVTQVTDVRFGAGKARDRARVTLDLRTGRTHQARVQLATMGAPIAGDRLYDGAPASRLMLHACGLTLADPRTKKPLTASAPEPLAFARFMQGETDPWLVYDDGEDLAARLRVATDRRYALAWSGENRTDAFRLVNEAGDDLPGLAVDVYGAFAVAQFYEGEDRGWSAERRAMVLDALHAMGFDGVYEKHRPKHASVLVDTRRADVAPAHASRGVDAPEPHLVREETMLIETRLGDGLSTGIFLDQRRARAAIRAASKGKRVLNLFSYTCAFTAAAALGGARSSLSVDVSHLVLDRGRKNLARNGIKPDPHHVFLAEDVLAWIDRAAKAIEKFDVIIVDPPSYATTKKTRFSLESDLEDLVKRVLALASDRGALVYVSTNHRGISRGKFRHALLGAVRAAGRDLEQLKDGAEPTDYLPAPGRDLHLKSAWIRLGSTLTGAQRRGKRAQGGRSPKPTLRSRG